MGNCPLQECNVDIIISHTSDSLTVLVSPPKTDITETILKLRKGFPSQLLGLWRETGAVRSHNCGGRSKDLKFERIRHHTKPVQAVMEFAAAFGAYRGTPLGPILGLSSTVLILLCQFHSFPD